MTLDDYRLGFEKVSVIGRCSVMLVPIRLAAGFEMVTSGRHGEMLGSITWCLVSISAQEARGRHPESPSYLPRTTTQRRVHTSMVGM